MSSLLAFLAIPNLQAEEEELPPIMPQSYLGEKPLDDTSEYANGQSKAQGALKLLKEIRPLVKSVKKDFNEGDLGKDVQSDQKEIVDVLAEIIEKNRPKKSKSEDEKEQQKEQKKQQAGKQGPPTGGKESQQATASSPAGDSIFRGGTTSAGDLRKFVEDPRRSWGKLPLKEREKMKQEMEKKLPKSHASWIEEFTKAMSAGKE